MTHACDLATVRCPSIATYELRVEIQADRSVDRMHACTVSRFLFGAYSALYAETEGIAFNDVIGGLSVIGTRIFFHNFSARKRTEPNTQYMVM